MSLIFSIKSRRAEDLINEGFRASLTGTLGSGTDHVIFSCPTDRLLAVAGVILSSNSDTIGLVQLGFKPHAGGPTTDFVRGYIAGDGPNIDHSYSVGDWRYGNLGYDLVLTCDVQVAYTIDCRVISEPTPLGYIEREGAAGHRGDPVFPDESGLARGQSAGY